jgi:hypothetical protein
MCERASGRRERKRVWARDSLPGQIDPPLCHPRAEWGQKKFDLFASPPSINLANINHRRLERKTDDDRKDANPYWMRAAALALHGWESLQSGVDQEGVGMSCSPSAEAHSRFHA